MASYVNSTTFYDLFKKQLAYKISSESFMGWKRKRVLKNVEEAIKNHVNKENV